MVEVCTGCRMAPSDAEQVLHRISGCPLKAHRSALKCAALFDELMLLKQVVSFQIGNSTSLEAEVQNDVINIIDLY